MDCEGRGRHLEAIEVGPGDGAVAVEKTSCHIPPASCCYGIPRSKYARGGALCHFGRSPADRAACDLGHIPPAAHREATGTFARRKLRFENRDAALRSGGPNLVVSEVPMSES